MSEFGRGELLLVGSQDRQEMNLGIPFTKGQCQESFIQISWTLRANKPCQHALKALFCPIAILSTAACLGFVCVFFFEGSPDISVKQTKCGYFFLANLFRK